MLNLEGIESKFKDVCESDSFKQIQTLFNERQNIIVLGNGGNYAVAQHGAADCSRLTTKNVISLDSPTYLTSIANDNGYEELFVKWLDTLHIKNTFNKDNAFIIGLSSTGTSKNICGALNWSVKNGVPCCIITGKPSVNLRHKDRRLFDDGVIECILETEHFHTAEILSLILFYQLVEGAGECCPLINDEKDRRAKLSCNFDNLSPYVEDYNGE